MADIQKEPEAGIRIKIKSTGGSIKQQKETMKDVKEFGEGLQKIINELSKLYGTKSSETPQVQIKMKIFCSDCNNLFDTLNDLETHKKKTGHKDL